MRAACVFCVSEYVRAGIVRSVPRVHAIIVHLGNMPLPGVSSEDIETVKKRYGLEKYSPIILTVGDIKHRKGQMQTLKAAVALKDRFPSIGYVAVGTDSDERYVKAMQAYTQEHGCPEILKVLTNVESRADVAALFNLCSAYALNSNTDGDHTEGFGLSIIEANSAGKLAVGSKGTGIEDAIRDGYNGYLVPQGDTDAIASGIEKILREDPVASAVRAKEFAARFTWDKTTEGYQTAYAE
jgi:phosphatidylinositol alpha-1,6-mannosyltransferase